MTAALLAAGGAWAVSALVDRRGSTPANRRGPRRHAVSAIAAAAAASGAVALTGPTLAAVPYLYTAIAGVALARIDAYELRLPNRLVLPAYPITAVAFAADSVFAGTWIPLACAAIGGVVLWGFYRLLHALRPRELGRGDVKLAGVLGAQLAWLSWSSWQIGAMAAFVLFIVANVSARRGRHQAWTSTGAFGPHMLLGAALAVCAAALTA